MGAGVGELSVEAAGAAQPGPEVEAVLVVGAMARAAERHDAVGVVAAAVLARYDVRGIDGPAAADQAVAPADLRPLRLRRRHERKRPHRRATQRRGAPHAGDGRPRVSGRFMALRPRGDERPREPNAPDTAEAALREIRGAADLRVDRVEAVEGDGLGQLEAAGR